jgi:hypothetical protein
VAVVAVGAIALLSQQRSALAAGIPSPDLTLAVDVDNSGPNECDTDTTTGLGSTCSVTVSSQFTLDVYLRTLTGLTDGPDPDTVVEYDGLQVLVDYTGLTFNNRPGYGEVVAPPSCAIQLENSAQPNQEAVGCVDNDTFSILTYTGRMFELDLTCPASPGSFTLSMVHGTPSNSHVSNEFFAAVVDQNADTDKNPATPQNESLSINCVNALPPGDGDGDGLSDTFESGFGGAGIQITNPETGNTGSAAGSAAAGATITSGSLTVTLPAGTSVQGGGTNKILIEYQPGPPPRAHIVNATWPNQNSPIGPRKSIEMPTGGYTAVCIADAPDALISAVSPGSCSTTVAAGCQQFALQIPIPGSRAARSMDPDGVGGQTCTPTTYTVTAQPGNRVRVDGLVYTAVGLVPQQQSLGGVAAYPDLSSGPGFGVLAGALAAALSIVALGGAWYGRRRLLR